jgi:hypothetical protein
MQNQLTVNEVASELGNNESRIEQFAGFLGLPINESWYVNAQLIASHCGTLAEFHRLIDAD